MNAEPIPGYRLIERLGRGGYGEVWKAEAPGGMHKAIKFVYGDMDKAGDDGKAAEQEFRSLNRVKTIRHPFLLSLERIEIIDGQLVIVMELADRNLFDRFAECVESGLPGIPRPELLRYIEEAAEALDLMNLHHQIQHLDIKPQNIFLVHRHVKVADFGLAKDLEGTRGELTGGITPMYAAPETFDQWVSRQSDQYSLAIVYAEMLTGKRPFTGTAPRQLILQHLTAAPDLSLLPSPDKEAVARALSKKPEDRFPTCMDFVLALKGELAPSVIKAPDTSAEPGTKGNRPESGASFYTDTMTRTRSLSLPRLVTPQSKVFSQAEAGSTRRPGSIATQIHRKEKPVERTGDGSLFPALVVGLGGTGAATLRKLTQIVTDRFGRSRLPHFRFLYIDTDPEAVQAVQSSGPGTSLTADEVLFAQLQRPAHYLSRDGLPPVDRWLSAKDLYRIPRRPATESVRGIGRLALFDHYHAVCHRIRAALEAFITPAAIEAADRLTGLGIRSTFPRVYVVGSLVGGTGSGMFLDLAYLIRRELRDMGFGPRVIGLLGMPGPNYPQTDHPVLANTRAALVELQHFGRPGAPYVAQFDTREKPVEDADPAFQRCLLVPVASVNTVGLAVSAMGHILFADTLSPLGRVVHADPPKPDRSLSAVGIQRIVWPRAQVLRAAAWLMARRTLAHWMTRDGGWAASAVPEIIQTQWAERGLDGAAVGGVIGESLVKALGGPPQDRIAKILAPLTRISNSDRLPTERLLAAFSELIRLVGKPGLNDEQSGEVATALTAQVKDLASKASAKIGAVILSLVEQPGLRLAGAEDAVHLLTDKISNELTLARQEAILLEDDATNLLAPIHSRLMSACDDAPDAATKGATALATSSTLSEWALLRLKALIAHAGASVYYSLLASMPDHVRELNLIRAQLESFIKRLDETAPSESTRDGVCVPIFPDGAATATDAVKNVLRAVGREQVKEFENALQGRIRHECRGVAEVCHRPKEAMEVFLTLLREQAAVFLDSRAPKLKSVQVLAQNATDADDLEARVTELIAEAAPELSASTPISVTVLGLPDEGEEIAGLVRHICRVGILKTATSPDDVVIWRECRGLSVKSFSHLSAELAGPRDYDASRPSPHSRNDIVWAVEPS